MEGGETGDINLYKVPLTAFTFEAKNLLSCLLNTSKILLSDGPMKLPRDWRGLASLVGISSEIAGSYESTDKIARIIEYWTKKDSADATVGHLLEFVQKIDRYDVFDDFMDLSARGQLVLNQRIPPRIRDLATPGCMQLQVYDEDIEENIITFDDKIHGSTQFYHAYVLYAYEDKEFVDEMLQIMRSRGYKMCTEDDLLPTHASTYAAVSRLISSERCHRIILIYSPAFLESPANNFYMDYAQAVGIEMKKPKIVPCMYRACVLPPQMSFYHKLYYPQPGTKASYDFWDRLCLSLEINNGPRITYPSHSTVNITEVSNSSYSNGNYITSNRLLALPSANMTTSSSMNQLADTQSSISDERRVKGRNKFGFFLSLKKLRFRKKKKLDVAVPNNAVVAVE